MSQRNTLQIPSLQGLSPLRATLQGKAPIYSDHDPLVDDDILVWNIQNQGKKTYSFCNNGHGITETDDEYKARLQLNALLLAEMVTHNPQISLICLQEAPLDPFKDAFWAAFQAALPASTPFDSTFFMKTGKNLSSRVVFYRNDRYTLKTQLDNGSGAQLCSFTDTTGEDRLIANIHLPYDVNGPAMPLATLRALMAAGYTVVGDSNISSSHIDSDAALNADACHHYFPDKNNLFYDKEDPAEHHYDSVDVVLINKQDKVAEAHRLAALPKPAAPQPAVPPPMPEIYYYLGMGVKEIERLNKSQATLAKSVAILPVGDRGSMASYCFRTEDEAKQFAQALAVNGITLKVKSVYPIRLSALPSATQIFEEAIRTIQEDPRDDAQAKASKQGFVQSLKDLQIATAHSSSMNAKAKILAEASRDLSQGLATGDVVKAKKAVADFNQKTGEFKKSWGWRMILGAVVGAAIGFILGAIIGAASGPGAAVSALAGGAYGAWVGASILGAAGAMVGGGLGMWRDRNDPRELPLKKVESSALRMAKTK